MSARRTVMSRVLDVAALWLVVGAAYAVLVFGIPALVALAVGGVR